MAVRFVVVDDDINIRRIIRNIIEQHELGIVVAECEDGLQAEKMICECQPDIALVDLLLPEQDGVQLIEKICHSCANTAFIMISQARSEPLITQAYQSGIEFFIHKPINVLEIVSVIKTVQEKRNLKQIMSIISRTTAQYSATPANDHQLNREFVQKDKMNKVFSDLGIISELGSKDIYKLAQMIEQHIQLKQEKYQLLDLYEQLSLQVHEDAKTIKQRVRRAITKALQNLANMGCEDYYNENFQNYSTTLFDFKEVRTEMDFVNGKSKYRGKINVKKFIEGVLFAAN